MTSRDYRDPAFAPASDYHDEDGEPVYKGLRWDPIAYAFPEHDPAWLAALEARLNAANDWHAGRTATIAEVMAHSHDHTWPSVTT